MNPTKRDLGVAATAVLGVAAGSNPVMVPAVLPPAVLKNDVKQDMLIREALGLFAGDVDAVAHVRLYCRYVTRANEARTSR